MGHYFDSGMFVREPAWHGLGNVVQHDVTSWKQARKLAGLEWEPLEAPVYGFVGVDAKGKVTYSQADAVTGDFTVIEERKRTLRSDTGANLGVPSIDYEIINHAEIGMILEALGKQKGVKYETTVSLKGGKQIAAVIRLDEPIKLPRDDSPTMPLLALTADHTGAGSCRAQSTTIRIVCANTYGAAESQADRNGTVFVFRHTKNWRDHIEEAQAAIRGLRSDFGEYVDFAKELIKVRVDAEQTRTWLDAFIPMSLTTAEMSERQIRNREEARGTVMNILNGVTCAPFKGTAFGWVQAGGEYLDHYTGGQTRTGQEARFSRQVLAPSRDKLRLVQVIRDVVAV